MDELAKQIETRLAAALRQAREVELLDYPVFGLAEATHGGATIRLSLADVARIAAAEARGWYETGSAEGL